MRCFRLSGVLFLVLLLFACSQEANVPLRVGVAPWPGYEPLFLAEKEGAYSSQHIHFIEYPSPSGSVRALSNGSIEAAALTLDEVLKLLESNVPIKVVLVTDISEGGDAILARPGVESVAQLQGQRIAAENSVLAKYMLIRALQIHGLELSDVTIVNASITEQLTLYKSGLVDAMLSYEPTRTQLIKQGAREIFSSKDIPGEIVDVLVVREDYLKENSEQVQVLVDGWYFALEYLQNDPVRSSIVLSHRLKITPAEVLSSFDGIRLPSRKDVAEMLGNKNGNLMQVSERLMNTMKQQSLLNKSLTIKSLFTDEFVRSR